MSSAVHLGIDLSTTTARCVVLDAELRVVASGRCTHTSITHKLRQSADHWKSSVESAMRDAISAAGLEFGDVVSVGIATQGVTAMFVGETAEETMPSRGWLDAGEDPHLILSPEMIEGWYQRSGRVLTSGSLAARLLEDASLVRGRWALAGDLITHQLTGNWSVDSCLAATTGLLDQSSRQWSEDLLETVGLNPASLSTVTPSGLAAGNALGEMAVRLGLQPDAVIASPTQDQRAAVLVADPDETATTVTFGTAAAVVQRAPAGDSRLSAQVPVTPGLLPETWWYEGVVLSAGATFDWFAALMGCPTTAAWFDIANELQVGSAGIICDPWFGGRGSASWDFHATAALRGLQLGASRAEVARAVVDSVCWEIVRNMSHFDRVTDVRMIGRATTHPVVARTIATMLDRCVTRVICEEPTAFGAALLGAQASGHIDSAHNSSRLAWQAETIEPRAAQ